ncbi:unnamed protein product [Oncorhynchus mykiss]|uniref:Uncharacterized protein n=1 Tax=Oncorhynchus mykiss TaxID=8022 RepID=A0A060YFS5_ONCMY|nr:unnamed protein product [Oncorhynchus mykiss]
MYCMCNPVSPLSTLFPLQSSAGYGRSRVLASHACCRGSSSKTGSVCVSTPSPVVSAGMNMPLHQISVIPRDVPSSRVSSSGKAKDKDKPVVTRISACLADISAWMSAHHLKLNLDKTELLFLPGKAHSLQDLDIPVDSSTMSPSRV